MSANYPPPEQNPYAQPAAPPPAQPAGQNPYAQPPATQFGPPPQGVPPQGVPAPFGYPQQPGAPGAFNGAGYPAPTGQMAAPPPNVALGVLAGVGAAIVVAIAYGWLIGLTKHEIGYAAVGVGFLVGAVVGKVGGRSRALPFAGLVLALLGVFLGQFLGEAIIGAHANGLSVTTALTDYTHDVFQGWKDDFDVMSFLFMAVAGAVGFQTPRRMNG